MTAGTDQPNVRPDGGGDSGGGAAGRDATAARLSRARHLAELGRLEAAATEVGLVLASEPHNATALLLLAYCHQQANRPAEMLDVAERAVAGRPDAPAAHRVRSRALRLLGRHREAVVAAEHARALDPRDVQSEVARVNALLTLGGTRALLAAAAGAARARQLAPENVDVHLTEGDAQRRMAEFGRARAAYRRALRLDPNDRRALHALSTLDSERGRALRASPGLDDVLRAHPDDAAARYASIRSARRVLWLLTDLGCVLQFLVTIVVAMLVDGVPGRTGPASGAAVLVLGTLGVTLLLRWRLGRLPATTRTLLRSYRFRFTFVTAPLRVVSLVAAALLMLAGRHLPAALEVVGSVLLVWPFLMLLLRARNWFAAEVFYLVRRCWFRLHPRTDPGLNFFPSASSRSSAAPPSPSSPRSRPSPSSASSSPTSTAS